MVSGIRAEWGAVDAFENEAFFGVTGPSPAPDAAFVEMVSGSTTVERRRLKLLSKPLEKVLAVFGFSVFAVVATLGPDPADDGAAEASPRIVLGS